MGESNTSPYPPITIAQIHCKISGSMKNPKVPFKSIVNKKIEEIRLQIISQLCQLAFLHS
jgi:hypothetical protein